MRPGEAFLSMLDCAVLYLDFDGVVADSMSGKTKVFADAVAPLKIAADDAARFYRAQAGVGRGRIFDMAAQAILKRALAPAEREAAQLSFARLEREARPGIRLFDGVAEFLTRQRLRRRLALVTGTPEEIIGDALASLGLGRTFHAVHSTAPGRPKESIIADDLRACGEAPGRALFAGDSRADMAAAERVPLRFVAIGEPVFFAGGAPCLVLDRLVDLEAHLPAS